MSILAKLAKRGTYGKISSLFDPQPWLFSLFGAQQNESGEQVTPATSMQVTAVYANVALIAEAIAMLPIDVMRVKKGTLVRDPEHYLTPLLNQGPNREQTAIEFKDMIQGHALLRGNGFAQKIFDGEGRVVELVPLHPDRMYIERDGASLIYRYSTLDGRQAELDRSQIFHYRGRSDDGVMGMSPIQVAANAVGLALATERHAARLFGRAARPDGLLKHPSTVSPEAYDRLKKSWKENYAGPGGSHGLAILEEGMSWEQIGMRNDEAQFLETRQFGVEEICRIFKTRPHMIGASRDKNSGTPEQHFREFLTITLDPWITRLEQAAAVQLLTERDRLRGYMLRVRRDAFLRGDMMAEAQYGATGRQWGWFCADDVRERMGMNPLPDGKGQEFLRPVNMTMAGEPPPGGASPENPPAPDTVKKLVDPNPKRTLNMEFEPVNPADREQIQEAFAPVFLAEMGRIQRREALNLEKNALKIAKTGDFDDFRAWAEGYYAKHRQYVAEVLEPGIAGYLRATNDERDHREIAQAFAAEYCRYAINAICKLLESAEPAEVLERCQRTVGALKNTQTGELWELWRILRNEGADNEN